MDDGCTKWRQAVFPSCGIQIKKAGFQEKQNTKEIIGHPVCEHLEGSRLWSRGGVDLSIFRMGKKHFNIVLRNPGFIQAVEPSTFDQLVK